MTARESFIRLVYLAAESETLRRLTLSKPHADAAERAVGRVSTARGQKILALELTLPQGKVKHIAYRVSEIEKELPALLASYGQANLMTAAGDATLLVSKKGKETLIGGEPLKKKLTDGAAPVISLLTPLDRQKNYILGGKEPFLIPLGISDANGRIHDKKQGKFRQINRFLEYIADLYDKLPSEGKLTVYDLCCGKSYLSFAVYYYLHDLKGREVDMLCMDLKADVIAYCAEVAREADFTGMRFLAGDIRALPASTSPDLVVSLHACDIATDIVLDTAAKLGAGVILSPPCCHRYLNHHLDTREFSFVTAYPHLKGKLAEVFTEGLRLAKLKSEGYTVSASELTDPDDTPKNTLLIAVKRNDFVPASDEAKALRREYEDWVTRLTGCMAENYPEGIRT